MLPVTFFLVWTKIWELRCIYSRSLSPSDIGSWRQSHHLLFEGGRPPRNAPSPCEPRFVIFSGFLFFPTRSFLFATRFALLVRFAIAHSIRSTPILAVQLPPSGPIIATDLDGDGLTDLLLPTAEGIFSFLQVRGGTSTYLASALRLAPSRFIPLVSSFFHSRSSARAPFR